MASWEKITEAIHLIINEIGDDPNRPGLYATPRRIAKSWDHIYGGYKLDPKDFITTFKDDTKCDQIILLKDIEFYSTCEHHMMPFFGKAHIAYIPKNNHVIGISKLARILDIYARRLQIQERICEQVTSALMEHLQPLGAACIIQAKHLCMMMRGVEKQNSEMVTSSVVGAFRDVPSARAELMDLLR